MCGTEWRTARGACFAGRGDAPLRGDAAELDCTAWAQLYLKYLVSHPAVTAVIPGTTKVEHAIDNNGATRGRMPDAAMRARIEATYDQIAGA